VKAFFSRSGRANPHVGQAPGSERHFDMPAMGNVSRVHPVEEQILSVPLHSIAQRTTHRELAPQHLLERCYCPKFAKKKSALRGVQ